MLMRCWLRKGDMDNIYTYHIVTYANVAIQKLTWYFSNFDNLTGNNNLV